MISELINKYLKLSFFEINKEVTLALGLPIESDEATQYEQIGDSLGYYDKDRVISILSYDYCSEPDLAYPIIFDNKISVYWNGGPNDTWKARTVHIPFVEHENPLCAGMIVFLVMSKLENKED